MDSLRDGGFVDDGDLILFGGVRLIAVDFNLRGFDLDVDVASTLLICIYD